MCVVTFFIAVETAESRNCFLVTHLVGLEDDICASSSLAVGTANITYVWLIWEKMCTTWVKDKYTSLTAGQSENVFRVSDPSA